MKKKLLDIQNLSVTINKKKIVDRFDLSIKTGELHVLMGPNGSGKSTIAYSILGHPGFTVRAAQLSFEDKNLKQLTTDERARLGIFLGFQYPLAVNGISLSSVIPAALEYRIKQKRVKKRVYATLASRMAYEQHVAREWFRGDIAENLASLGMQEEMLYRSLNEGFSGGEKKKAEVLQMLALSPKLAILDEPDSGLDVDALRRIAKAIHRAHQGGMAILLITHYQRILKYLRPDRVHIVSGGRLSRSGGPELARMIERHGYESLNPHGHKNKR
ncbi:MAG: Fe-S cluster assembly ATPase SufC [Patescibacteria group bacterium]